MHFDNSCRGSPDSTEAKVQLVNELCDGLNRQNIGNATHDHMIAHPFHVCDETATV